MEKKQIQRRLEVTVRQTSLLEQCIANAKESESDMNPRIYKVMIAGYESLRDELIAEAQKYRQELGLK